MIIFYLNSHAKLFEGAIIEVLHFSLYKNENIYKIVSKCQIENAIFNFVALHFDVSF